MTMLIGLITNEELAALVTDDDLVDVYMGAHEDGCAALEQGDTSVFEDTQALCTLLAARFTAAQWEELHQRRA